MLFILKTKVVEIDVTNLLIYAVYSDDRPTFYFFLIRSSKTLLKYLNSTRKKKEGAFKRVQTSVVLVQYF